MSFTWSVVTASSPAAERVQLDQIQILACLYKIRCCIETAVVHPLVEDDQRTLDRIQVRDRVLGEHGKTIGINQLRDAVVDLSVNMVRRPASTMPCRPVSFRYCKVS